VGIAAGIGVILLILLIVIVWLCCRNSSQSRRNNSGEKKEDAEGGHNSTITTTDANENIPGESSKLLEHSNNTTVDQSHIGQNGTALGRGVPSPTPSTPTSDANLDSMLGKLITRLSKNSLLLSHKV
jgi:hypothetical protein